MLLVCLNRKWAEILVKFFVSTNFSEYLSIEVLRLSLYREMAKDMLHLPTIHPNKKRNLTTLPKISSCRPCDVLCVRVNSTSVFWHREDLSLQVSN